MTQQLAQIQLPKGLLDVDWNPYTKTIYYTYNGKGYTGQDEEIGVTIQRCLGFPASDLYISDLHYFEHPGHAIAAPPEMQRDLLICNWSDYAIDNMAFQCAVDLKI
jgi:hypothetical protein